MNQVIDDIGLVRLVCHIDYRLHSLQGCLGNGFHEFLAHLSLHGIRPLLRHDGSNGVLLAVGVILEFRILQILSCGKEGHHILAEALRHHDGRVVLAGFGPLDGFFTVGEYPVHLIIFMEIGQDFIAQVDVDGQQIALVACVVAGHRNLDSGGILIGIPAAADVEPGVQRGDHQNTNHHNHGNGVAFYLAYISQKNL